MEILPIEHLTNHPRFVKAYMRSRIANGWYVRMVFCHAGVASGAFSESAAYFDDPDRSWDPAKDEWHWIADEPHGGIFQCAVPRGWLVMATAQGESRMRNGELLDTRFGSLTFVPDADHLGCYAKIRELNGDPVHSV